MPAERELENSRKNESLAEPLTGISAGKLEPSDLTAAQSALRGELLKQVKREGTEHMSRTRNLQPQAGCQRGTTAGLTR